MVRLASVAMTSFGDARAQRAVLAEIARVVDRSVTHAAGYEDFVTALFAEFDRVAGSSSSTCGHPLLLRLTADGDLQALNRPRTLCLARAWCAGRHAPR